MSIRLTILMVNKHNEICTYLFCKAIMLHASSVCILSISKCTESDKAVAVKSGEYPPSDTVKASAPIMVQGPFSV